MNYNEKKFEHDFNQELNSQIHNLIVIQEKILKFFIDFLTSTNQKEQLEHCECFIELAIKIRFNLESAIIILPKLSDDYRFKTSLNLIYRSIIDDLINVFYLSKFVILNEKTQVSLENELIILHKEFLSSIQKGIKADNQYQQIIDELLKKTSEKTDDVSAIIESENPTLYNNKILKKNKEIRSTTNQQLKERLKPSDSDLIISETKKIVFISHHDKLISAALTGLFKYFSQFHHYSGKTHQLILSDAELDIFNYNKTLLTPMELPNLYLKFMNFNDIEELKIKFKELTKNLSIKNN